jgi:lipooligosaccharide transport system permease protein
VRAVSEWLPLTQAVHLIRPLFLDRWPDQVLLPAAVIAAYSIFAWAIALALTRKRFRS